MEIQCENNCGNLTMENSIYCADCEESGSGKQKFDYENGNFERNLDNFILACLKDYSTSGSLTKKELVEWFSSRIESAIEDFKCRNREL